MEDMLLPFGDFFPNNSYFILPSAELIIHNADFDRNFLDHEISIACEHTGLPLDHIGSICTITDSLQLAKQKYPGQRNSLDALCKRHQIDLSVRNKHGALLDAELLAQVYLRMTGGQISLTLEPDTQKATQKHQNANRTKAYPRIHIAHASAEDIARHRQWLAAAKSG